MKEGTYLRTKKKLGLRGFQFTDQRVFLLKNVINKTFSVDIGEGKKSPNRGNLLIICAVKNGVFG